MPFLFCFTDAPQLGDVWETNLDVDILIHTRPPLLAERNRYAVHYGTAYAQNELQYFVVRGLKAYGYQILPSLYYLVSNFLLKFETEAHDDLTTASDALEEAADDDVQADFNSRERLLWEQTLDTPELIEQFVSGPLTRLADLDPIARMTEIYRLRATQFAQNIPFSKNAVTILAKLFEKTDEQSSYTSISGDCIANVHKALIADIVAGLIERLHQNTQFLDQILTDWVVPKLQDRFSEIDDEIDQFCHHSPDYTVERTDFIVHRKAEPKWLALAKKLGAPVPQPTLHQSMESPHQH